MHGRVSVPLEVCGYDAVPVAQGAAEPLAQPLRIASHVHGSDGLGDVEEPAPVHPSLADAVSVVLAVGIRTVGESDI